MNMRIKLSRNIKSIMQRSAFTALLVCAGAIHASDYLWTGAVSTDFSNAANWLVDGVVPATPPANKDSGDIVVLPAAVTANQPALTGDQALRGVVIEGAGWTLTTGAYKLSVGPHNIGVTTTYASGTSTIAGTLRVGTTDQTATCWVIAEGGTLRVDGAIARYGSGGGATRKEGDGTLELNTGTSKVNALIINGGTVRAINGCGGGWMQSL